jgi:hypothetical protein
MEDFIGKKFNRLTVLEFIPLKERKNPRCAYKCQCDCGKIIYYRSDVIKSGRRKSCGCITSPSEKEYVNRLKERLMKNHKKDGDCWIWTGRIHAGGYGFLSYRSKENKSKKTASNAHRVAYKVWKGDVPKELYVLHKCDNRKCINPDHLWLGTHIDNMKDMISKNRQDKRPGEKHHVSIFLNENIYEIRRLWDEGLETQAGLARKYGASLTCIHNIVRRKTWKHLPEVVSTSQKH